MRGILIGTVVSGFVIDQCLMRNLKAPSVGPPEGCTEAEQSEIDEALDRSLSLMLTHRRAFEEFDAKSEAGRILIRGALRRHLRELQEQPRPKHMVEVWDATEAYVNSMIYVLECSPKSSSFAPAMRDLMECADNWGRVAFKYGATESPETPDATNQLGR
eukprot:g14907.t1